MTVYAKTRHLVRNCFYFRVLQLNIPSLYRPRKFQLDRPFCFRAINTFVRVIRVCGIAQTAIFVGVGTNEMFPYTYSATRGCKIDHLLLADDRVRRVFDAFYRWERADDIEINPLVSNTFRKTVQLPTAYFHSAYSSVFAPAILPCY